ncbi:uncharacterized protein LOC134204113 [Armigeres subalbatus]|uniref:uncharacterized protein LOC134204113 n=1 Tax=Armigeres subalbatus TaxID=124917 RepID=UPI002ED36496
MAAEAQSNSTDCSEENPYEKYGFPVYVSAFLSKSGVDANNTAEIIEILTTHNLATAEQQKDNTTTLFFKPFEELSPWLSPLIQGNEGAATTALGSEEKFNPVLEEASPNIVESCVKHTGSDRLDESLCVVESKLAKTTTTGVTEEPGGEPGEHPLNSVVSSLVEYSLAIEETSAATGVPNENPEENLENPVTSSDVEEIFNDQDKENSLNESNDEISTSSPKGSTKPVE